MGKLAGKRALVTGGGTGIGREIAHTFLEQGARVVICGRRHGPLKETVDDLGKGGEIHFVECDISDPADIDALVAKTGELLGGLDILVNNAGIYEGGSVETAGLKEWDRTLNINLRGVFLLTKACMPHLREAGRGANVLNISSTMARDPAVRGQQISARNVHALLCDRLRRSGRALQRDRAGRRGHADAGFQQG